MGAKSFKTYLSQLLPVAKTRLMLCPTSLALTVAAGCLRGLVGWWVGGMERRSDLEQSGSKLLRGRETVPYTVRRLPLADRRNGRGPSFLLTRCADGSSHHLADTYVIKTQHSTAIMTRCKNPMASADCLSGATSRCCTDTTKRSS